MAGLRLRLQLTDPFVSYGSRATGHRVGRVLARQADRNGAPPLRRRCPSLVTNFPIRSDFHDCMDARRPLQPAETLNGAWLSLVERLLWEQDVGGSNPLAPTTSPRMRAMGSRDEGQ